MRVRRSILWYTLSFLSMLAFLGAFELAEAQQPAPAAIPVSVAKPLAKRITRWDEYSGRFAAVNTVEVRARVSGFIDKISFHDGQLVKEGDLLFTLDQRPFRLAVDSAKAEVARTKATVDFASTDLQRAEPLVRSGAISDQVFDQRRSSLSQNQAQLQAAQVAVRNAELNLEWSEVRAPISGRISNRKVDVGNLVAGGEAASTTLLSTIVSQDPIYFQFDISETDALRYLRLGGGGAKAARDAKNPVRIKLADEDKFTHEGTMDFLDNQLSTRSGTLRGRAILPNPDDLFQPGLFARLQLWGGEYDALLIPDDAVVSDQASKIVFVVGPDNLVKQVPVKLGAIDNGLRVVEKGLSPDDLVIVNGIANPGVRAGVKVAPKQTQIQTATN